MTVDTKPGIKKQRNETGKAPLITDPPTTSPTTLSEKDEEEKRKEKIPVVGGEHSLKISAL